MNHLGLRAAALLRPACRGPYLSSFKNGVASPIFTTRWFSDTCDTEWHTHGLATYMAHINAFTPPRRTFDLSCIMESSVDKCRSQEEMYAARNRSLLMYTTAVIVLGVGTPKVGMGKFEADRLVPVEDAKRIKVHFNADTSDALPWSFVPQQKFVRVLPGETSLAFYKAKNTSDKDIIGIATYNVTPDRIAPYFAKVECFCFEEQKLLAGEEVDMPLLFFIDRLGETRRDILNLMLLMTSCKHLRDSQIMSLRQK
ncbi:transporter [Ganoderma sinense ZZ0214-1]|uniref:Transporter n=1 Tax=Ganoderma sinense ZZ0214-1 TaxID=1077348 RepID=A0A2G8SP88_9APHY|nr:transporter [Ganoderma sinense ZZ0214-1]